MLHSSLSQWQQLHPSHKIWDRSDAGLTFWTKCTWRLDILHHAKSLLSKWEQLQLLMTLSIAQWTAILRCMPAHPFHTSQCWLLWYPKLSSLLTSSSNTSIRHRTFGSLIANRLVALNSWQDSPDSRGMDTCLDLNICRTISYHSGVSQAG